MSTAPQTNNSSQTGSENLIGQPKDLAATFLRQPATILQILLWILPLLGCFAVWLVKQGVAVEENTKDTISIRTSVDKIREQRENDKEGMMSRISVLERTANDTRDDVREIRGDVKTLIRAVGERR